MKKRATGLGMPTPASEHGTVITNLLQGYFVLRGRKPYRAQTEPKLPATPNDPHERAPDFALVLNTGLTSKPQIDLVIEVEHTKELFVKDKKLNQEYLNRTTNYRENGVKEFFVYDYTAKVWYEIELATGIAIRQEDPVSRLFEEDLHLNSLEACAAEDPFARESQIDELKADVNELKADVNELKADVNELKADVNELKADVNELKADVNELKADVNELKADVNELKARMTNVEVGIAAILAKLNGVNGLGSTLPDSYRDD